MFQSTKPKEFGAILWAWEPEPTWQFKDSKDCLKYLLTPLSSLTFMRTSKKTCFALGFPVPHYSCIIVTHPALGEFSIKNVFYQLKD